jgi:hypothetical protein
VRNALVRGIGGLVPRLLPSAWTWAFHVVLGVDYTRSATFSSFKDTFLQKTGAKACNEGHHDVRRHSGIPC